MVPRDFVASISVTDKELRARDFISSFAGICRTITPIARFVARALDMAW